MVEQVELTEPWKAEEVTASDYDALVQSGGVGNPDTLRMDENAVNFVREFFEERKPVAVICHGIRARATDMVEQVELTEPWKAEEVTASDYDALVQFGGVGNPDTLRMDENAVNFVREFFEERKPVAVICHGIRAR